VDMHVGHAKFKGASLSLSMTVAFYNQRNHTNH
jgi:hypothetical protein